MKIKTNVSWKQYAALVRKVYAGDQVFRDSLSPLVKTIMLGQSEFCRQINFTMTGVEKQGEIIAATMLVSTPKMPGMLQIAFFEALNDAEAVNALINYAKQTARMQGLSNVIAGLNGHMNYGMGFPTDGFELPAAFGSMHAPRYYMDMLRRHAGTLYPMTSYMFDLNLIDFKAQERIIGRVRRRISFRSAKLRELRKEVDIYTRLNNICFKKHPFYWERTPAEDYEMFNAFRPFLNGENFIIAEDCGKPVGFLLWYPDFNQLIPQGGKAGFTTFLKYRFFKHSITKCKIAEIGVLPEYQGAGVIAGLLFTAFNIAKKRYRLCETNWILDENFLSNSLTKHWPVSPYKHYTVMEMDI